MTGIRGMIVTIAATICALAAIGVVAIQVMWWLESRDHVDRLRSAIAEPHYEYKVIAVSSEAPDRMGEGAMRFSSVTPSQDELSKLGQMGWEVVGTYLELETAFPNFGKSEYVTGLQPNVRPQRAVLILRRRIA